MTKPSKIVYSDQTIEQIRLRYPECRTKADRLALAKELGIGSLQKLYNLAVRIGAVGDQKQSFATE